MKTQRVNITDFGGVGDGIHDDSEAFLMAATSRFAYICVSHRNWTINSSVGEIMALHYSERFVTCPGDGCRCHRQNTMKKLQ